MVVWLLIIWKKVLIILICYLVQMASFYLQCLMDMKVCLDYFFTVYQWPCHWMKCIFKCHIWNSIWQVGDSKEQNDSSNIVMINTKGKLLFLKREYCWNELINKSDLMMLINIVWNKLFNRIDKNRRAIANRGLGPYNRNILTFSSDQSYNDIYWLLKRH